MRWLSFCSVIHFASPAVGYQVEVDEANLICHIALPYVPVCMPTIHTDACLSLGFVSLIPGFSTPREWTHTRNWFMVYCGYIVSSSWSQMAKWFQNHVTKGLLAMQASYYHSFVVVGQTMDLLDDLLLSMSAVFFQCFLHRIGVWVSL